MSEPTKEELLKETERLINELGKSFEHNFKVLDAELDHLTSATLKRIIKSVIGHPFIKVEVKNQHEQSMIDLAILIADTKTSITWQAIAEKELRKELEMDSAVIPAEEQVNE